MMDNFPFWQNADGIRYMMGGYAMPGAIGLVAVLAIADLALKGWAMWRAARMDKQWWFVALLVFNTIGILPVIFLLLTNEEYKKKVRKS